jgi:hypothetical protein
MSLIMNGKGGHLAVKTPAIVSPQEREAARQQLPVGRQKDWTHWSQGQLQPHRTRGGPGPTDFGHADVDRWGSSPIGSTSAVDGRRTRSERGPEVAYG